MRGLCAALAILLTSCSGGELTEILVVVDSNVPSELDAVQVIVRGSATMSSSGSLTELPLPRTVGIVFSGGSIGPVEITAIGSRGGVAVVRSVVSTSFIRGRTLVLSMFLARDCRMITCAEGLTCANGMCVSNVVDPRTLPEWTGNVPRVDGGPECVPAREACNGMDDDCDGRVDEDFDFRTDSNNCGRCGTSCAAIANASATCSGSVCLIQSCNTGFSDCNMNMADGCETSLTSPSDCDACGMVCSFENATAACPTGTCELDACVLGFGDCNTDPADGCEATLDTLTDCAMCGVACAVANGTPTCATGSCAVEDCDAGFGDCNTDPSDGCETTLDSITNCGMCGMGCTITDGTGDCSTGSCEVASCVAERGDCNMDPSDGCETNTRANDMHCGRCMMPCLVTQVCRNSVCR